MDSVYSSFHLHYVSEVYHYCCLWLQINENHLFSLLPSIPLWPFMYTTVSCFHSPLPSFQAVSYMEVRRKFVCVNVFNHACVSVCVLHLTILRTQGSSTVFCSTLFYSICATSPLPSLVQQALSICSGKLPFAMEPQTSITWLSYCFATSMLFHGLCVNGWHFLPRAQGTEVTCILQRESPISESSFIWGKVTLRESSTKTQLISKK